MFARSKRLKSHYSLRIPVQQGQKTATSLSITPGELGGWKVFLHANAEYTSGKAFFSSVNEMLSWLSVNLKDINE